jgi:hypothetical protein
VGMQRSSVSDEEDSGVILLVSMNESGVEGPDEEEEDDEVGGEGRL